MNLNGEIDLGHFLYLEPARDRLIWQLQNREICRNFLLDPFKRTNPELADSTI